MCLYNVGKRTFYHIIDNLEPTYQQQRVGLSIEPPQSSIQTSSKKVNVGPIFDLMVEKAASLQKVINENFPTFEDMKAEVERSANTRYRLIPHDLKDYVDKEISSVTRQVAKLMYLSIQSALRSATGQQLRSTPIQQPELFTGVLEFPRIDPNYLYAGFVALTRCFDKLKISKSRWLPTTAASPAIGEPSSAVPPSPTIGEPSSAVPPSPATTVRPTPTKKKRLSMPSSLRDTDSPRELEQPYKKHKKELQQHKLVVRGKPTTTTREVTKGLEMESEEEPRGQKSKSLDSLLQAVDNLTKEEEVVGVEEDKEEVEEEGKIEENVVEERLRQKFKKHIQRPLINDLNTKKISYKKEVNRIKRAVMTLQAALIVMEEWKHKKEEEGEEVEEEEEEDEDEGEDEGEDEEQDL